MNRQRVDSQGSLGPNDEVMPYSDDETDDELDETSESEAEEPQEVPQPPVETRAHGLSEGLFCKIISLDADLWFSVISHFVNDVSQRLVGR